MSLVWAATSESAESLSKVIPYATCRTSDPNPGNSNPSSYLNSIPIVDDMNLLIAQRKGVRSCTQYSISKFVSYQHLSPSYRSFVSKLSSVSIPQNLQEAISDPKWREATQEEMRALHKNNTWELVELPSGTRIVEWKWVFTMKHMAIESEDRYEGQIGC